jgi:alpha-D-xyloside xylohydrolase
MRIFSIRALPVIGLLVLLGTCPSLRAQWVATNPVDAVEPQVDGVVLVLKIGFLRFQVCSDSIVHVVYSLERSAAARPDILVIKSTWPKTEFSLHNDDPKVITLSTAQVKIEVVRADNSIVFYDSAGHKLTQENTRTLTPTEVSGGKTYHSERFANMWDTQEAFYGLGQHQGGVWNYRGEAVDLSQDNTNISIPLLLSSNGYGIFWNIGSLRPRLLPELRSFQCGGLLLSLRAGVRPHHRIVS